MTTDVEKQDVTTVFWTNIEWHLENKGWTWRSAFGYQGSIYKQKQSNLIPSTIYSNVFNNNIDYTVYALYALL